MGKGGFVEKNKTTEEENRKQIERFLAQKKGRGATISEMQSETNLTWQTIKRHLDKLESIGRVHVELFGKTQAFFLNGEEQFKEKVQFGKHTLFIDCMISAWGEPFIRIKDRKKTDKGGEDVGAIIINKNKVKEVASKLMKMAPKLETYKT